MFWGLDLTVTSEMRQLVTMDGWFPYVSRVFLEFVALEGCGRLGHR